VTVFRNSTKIQNVHFLGDFEEYQHSSTTHFLMGRILGILPFLVVEVLLVLMLLVYSHVVCPDPDGKVSISH